MKGSCVLVGAVQFAECTVRRPKSTRISARCSEPAKNQVVSFAHNRDLVVACLGRRNVSTMLNDGAGVVRADSGRGSISVNLEWLGSIRLIVITPFHNLCDTCTLRNLSFDHSREVQRFRIPGIV